MELPDLRPRKCLLMEKWPPYTPDGLAYRTYRIWSLFWQDQDLALTRTPPLYHYGNTLNGGALIIAPCSVDEVKFFIASREADKSYHYTLEASELGTAWIGFWTLFSVSQQECE